jgi:putative DNA primase/helicase
MTTPRAAELHARIGPAWPAVLAQLGIAETALRLKKAGPCPSCGGTDRYTFDNRHERGDFFCRGCGAGDGFQLLQRVHGWSFPQALRQVASVAGMDGAPLERPTTRGAAAAESTMATPSRRVREMLRTSCGPDEVTDARQYLASRGLWPLPHACALRAHASVEYWEAQTRLGRFAALLAEVRDIAGELVTAHVTYLKGGSKLEANEPRKMLSPLTGRLGCAVRLMPIAGDALGIAEGLETALSASALHDDMPTWAALTTALLGKFEPPPEVRRLLVFADRDAPGLEAAGRLMERLQGRVCMELRLPPAPHKDWNDAHRSAA